jgi:hypothetical protein
VTVQPNGSLARTGFSFAGWNSAADGTGTSYSAGSTFTIVADTTLYAQWVRPQITWTSSGHELVLNWPAGQGWQLQARTNLLARGLGTSWSTVAGATPPYTNTLLPASSSVFYRLYRASATTFVIYKDRLAPGWSLNGWAGTVDLASLSPVHIGTASMAYILPAGAGKGPATSTYVSTTNYDFLSFWIHGGSSDTQSVTLQTVRAWGIAGNWYLPSPPVNAWVNYVVPLSLINLSNVPNFNGIRFVNNSGVDLPVFYVDDVQLQP